MLVLVFVMSGMYAQAKPQFFNKAEIVTLSFSAGLMAADIITTNQALHRPGAYEANPLGQSAASRYALKVAGCGAGLGISYAMYRTGHYKAARVVPLILGVPSGIAAIHNVGVK